MTQEQYEQAVKHLMHCRRRSACQLCAIYNITIHENERTSE